MRHCVEERALARATVAIDEEHRMLASAARQPVAEDLPNR